MLAASVGTEQHGRGHRKAGRRFSPAPICSRGGGIPDLTSVGRYATWPRCRMPRHG